MKQTDKEAEIRRLLPRAHQGYFDAQFDLGMAYVLMEQWAEAYFWLSLATIEPQSVFRLDVHLTLEQQASVKERAQNWHPAPDPEGVNFLADLHTKAEAGDTKAQFALGRTYKYGIIKHAKAAGQGGLARDLTEAIKWWRKAGEQGSIPAQFELGEAFSKGLGVRPDYTEALRWYRMAAAQGDALAQDNVNLLIEHGYGKRQDE